jgi:CheY-like chemotaxis protein
MDIRKVLIVDDDPAIQRMAMMSLSRIGKWEVVVAESGQQAIEEAQKAIPDVILMDVMMPRMDGPSTLRLLQQHEDLARVPVIFMTAKVLREEMESYTELGAAGVIKKPFDPLTLPASIRKLLDSASGAHHLASAS